MSHSVLLVEDDRAIATVVSEALGEEGYRVTACTSIARRDALLAEAEFDVMLTDIVLEDGDGLRHRADFRGLNIGAGVNLGGIGSAGTGGLNIGDTPRICLLALI